jgi:hypothetical protein
MKRFFTCMILAFVLMAFSSPAFGNPYWMRGEPALNTQVGWYLEPNGMLTVAYDLDWNGNPDFFAVRVVLEHYYSIETIETLGRQHPGIPIFRVEYGPVNYYYLASHYPLFYAWDTNEDGHWDVMYVDRDEDGWNGNEVFYDSPSGTFAPFLIAEI